MGYFEHHHSHSDQSDSVAKSLLLLAGVAMLYIISDSYYDTKQYNAHMNRHYSHAHEVTMPVDSVHANTSQPFNLDRAEARQAEFLEAREDEYLGGFF